MGNLALEWLAVFCSLMYVLLAIKNHVWCWPFGILGSALSVFLFMSGEIRLYSEAGLYFVYVLLGFYGWWKWSDAKSESQEIPITNRGWPFHLAVIVLGTGVSFALSFLLKSYTDASMPFLDSLTSVFGLIATWMVAKRLLENWIYWIVIDLLTVYLYAAKDLKVYAVLMGIYTVMAFVGWLNWKKIQSES